MVVANTGLPDASGGRAGGAVPFLLWRLFSRWTPVFPTSRIVDAGTVADLPDAVLAAYDAPFPTRRHGSGSGTASP